MPIANVSPPPRDTIYEDESIVLFRRRDGDGAPSLVKALRREHPEPREIALLRHEYAVTRPLEAPGVLVPTALERSPNGVELVFEDYDGRALTELAGNGHADTLDLAAVLSIGRAAAGSLAAIHRLRVIHKGVSPHALLVRPDGSDCRLTDFRLSSRVPREHEALASPARLVGRLPYMSPEQTGRMNRSVDARTDLYSLGVTLYQLLVGRLPFESDDPMELVHCHIARTPRPPHEVDPRIPAAVSEVVMKALAKRAEERYQTAHGLQADLERCIAALATPGPAAAFRPGRDDRARELEIPERLYGREAEIGRLLDAFDRAGEGGREVLLVAGWSGVGKSALVHEVHRPIVERRGYFAAGKFDQFKRHVPYSALIEAFSDLVRQLLTEPEPRVRAWRRRVLDALGDRAGVLTEVLPELEALIGPQPPADPLPPTESQIRFTLVSKQLVRALAAPEHPLVIFADDLQWADTASLDLVREVTAEESIAGLLFIGAYRDNEVGEGHPLVHTLGRMRERATPPTEIALAPLGVDDVGALLADALGRVAEDVTALAARVHRKTAGNPFYVRQFLRALETAGLLRFDEGSKRWRWELERIDEADTTSNVVELMVRKLSGFPEATRRVLELASCLGNHFALDTLALVDGRSPTDTATALWTAVAEGLVLPLDENYKFVLAEREGPADLLPERFPVAYRFLHDRVQEAAKALMDEERLSERHLHIGRVLAAHRAAGEAREESLFDLATHFHAAAGLLSDPGERLQVAGLMLEAGRKAKRASAFEPAAEFLATGLALLPEHAWDTYYALALGLHTEAAEAEYMRRRPERSDRLGAEVLRHARDPLDQVPVYELRIHDLATRQQMRAACEAAIEILRALGVRLPRRPTTPGALLAVLRMRRRLARTSIEALRALPDVTDPHMSAALSILAGVAPAAYQTSPQMLFTVITTELDLLLRHGAHASGMNAYGSWAVLLNALFTDLDGAYDYGVLGLETGSRFPEKGNAARAEFMFNNYHRPWREPQGDCVEPMTECAQRLLEVGDMEFYGYAVGVPPHLALFAGRPLDEVEKRFRAAIAAFEDLEVTHGMALVRSGLQLTRNLRQPGGATTELVGDAFDERTEVPRYVEAKHRSAVLIAELGAVVAAYVYGDAERAARRARDAEPYLDSVLSMVQFAEHAFFQALACLAAARETGGLERWKLVRRAGRRLRKLTKYAASAPRNFRPKRDLVSAELARTAGRDRAAVRGYESAVAGARAEQFLHVEAIAHERLSEHHREHGRRELADDHLRRAYRCYADWGAGGKARALARAHREVLGRGAPEGDADGLDLASVMKAARALSSEIVLERLMEKLLAIVIENAGAERGFLVRRHADGSVRVEAEHDGEQVRLLTDAPETVDDEHLSAAVVNLVLRTGEPFVADDASVDPRLAADPYVRRTEPRSILAVPIRQHGAVAAVLYVENDLTPGAFTRERVETLGLLASQAAISLENARLYADVSRLNEAYERFVPRQFLGHLHKRSIEDVSLGDGVRLECSVLFADIRAFTRLSEDMGPTDTFSFINAYLSRMEPIVRAHHGLIDKYSGDAIMALFDRAAPERLGADDAVRAAIEMLGTLDVLNSERLRRGHPAIQVGIGIHSGPVMLGTIGGSHRMDGTVVGDAVNLASRLEELTKRYHARILLSGPCRDQLADPECFHSRWLGRARVRGKRRWVDVHEVFDADPPEILERKLATRDVLAEGLHHLYGNEPDAARAAFRRVLREHPEDRVVRWMTEQLARLAASDATDWEDAELDKRAGE